MRYKYLALALEALAHNLEWGESDYYISAKTDDLSGNSMYWIASHDGTDRPFGDLEWCGYNTALAALNSMVALSEYMLCDAPWSKEK